MKKKMLGLLLSASIIGGLGFTTVASAAVYNGWINNNGIWSYSSNGQKLTGWIRPDGYNWYYLDSYGNMLTGFQKIDGKWYYLEESEGQNNGIMICNDIIGSYSFGADGALMTQSNTLLPDEAYGKLEDYLSEQGYANDEDDEYEYIYSFDKKTNSLNITVYSNENRIVIPFITSMQDLKNISSKDMRKKQIEAYINLETGYITSYSYTGC